MEVNSFSKRTTVQLQLIQMQMQTCSHKLCAWPLYIYIKCIIQTAYKRHKKGIKGYSPELQRKRADVLLNPKAQADAYGLYTIYYIAGLYIGTACSPWSSSCTAHVFSRAPLLTLSLTTLSLTKSFSRSGRFLYITIHEGLTINNWSSF